MLCMILFFALTLLVAAAGGIIGYKLKLPVGGMVGSMVAVILLNLVTEKAVFYPELRFPLQILGGAMIGSQIGREDLLAMKKIIFPTILLLLSMVVLNITFGTLMYVFSDLDLATALFASAPGGVSDMAIISTDLGANPAYVAIIQLCRLLTIFIFMPPIFRKIKNTKDGRQGRDKKAVSVEYSNSDSDSDMDDVRVDVVRVPEISVNLPNESPESVGAFSDDRNEAKPMAGRAIADVRSKSKLNTKNFIIMLIAATVSGTLVHYIGLAAGAMVGAMLASAAFCVFNGRMPFPKKLRLGMQIFSGAFIGIQLDREGLAHMGDLGIPLIILVVGIFFFVFLVSLLLHKVAKLDLMTSMLSSTPGGVQEMALLSEDIGGDTPKIAIMQTARLFSVILFFPTMLQFLLSILK